MAPARFPAAAPPPWRAGGSQLFLSHDMHMKQVPIGVRPGDTQGHRLTQWWESLHRSDTARPCLQPRAAPQPRLVGTPGLLLWQANGKALCKPSQAGSSHCSLFPDRINESQTGPALLICLLSLENNPQPPLLLIAFAIC